MTKRICKVPGCDDKYRAKGWCGKHYYRWRQHGDPLAGGTPRGLPLAWIGELLAAAPSDDCIEWPFGSSNGYGSIEVDGEAWNAHRYVLSLTTVETGEGMDAAHAPGVCHNPSCVNPAHLRWATRAENEADKAIDGTALRGEANHKAKLTWEQVLAIRADTRIQREIAADYGIAPRTVSDIKRRKRWAWLTDGTEE